MTRHTLKTGVIGLGFFGTRHARLYAEHPVADLVGVCDCDASRRDAVTRLTGAQGFDDFNALLALPELDAVSICLPGRLHEKAAVAAAQAGKMILLEKVDRAFEDRACLCAKT